MLRKCHIFNNLFYLFIFSCFISATFIFDYSNCYIKYCHIVASSQLPYVRQTYMTVLYLIVLTDVKPTRCEVLTQLAFINSQWREIGSCLGVSYNYLQGLSQSNDSYQTRLDHVIQKWFDMNGQGEGAPVTWNTIINVIKEPPIHNITRAMRIYEYLKAKSSVQQDTQSKWSIQIFNCYNYIDCFNGYYMLIILVTLILEKFSSSFVNV